MPRNFGTRLRQRREEKAIALTAIADETKIKLSLLEGLERDDVSHWPSGIFRRAYIRAYAHAIGLDADAVLREFLEIHPEPAEVVETVSTIASAVDARTNVKPPTRLRYILEATIASVSRLGHGSAIDDRGPAERAPARMAVRSEVDLTGVARLCTELGRAKERDDVQRLLPELARILDATGLIVWIWDAAAEELKAVLVHGYSEHVLAQLPAVRRDSDNATAAAFRFEQTCAVNGGNSVSGALAVPLVTTAGCAGVLAVELQSGGEQSQPVRAVATVVAALLALLISRAQPAGAASQSRTETRAIRSTLSPVGMRQDRFRRPRVPRL